MAITSRTRHPIRSSFRP